MFDCRNLLFSIINHHWVKGSNLVEVIEKIPDFINRVNENNKNKILVYYGDYKIDKIYQINEFLANNELSTFSILNTKNFLNYNKKSQTEKHLK